MPSDRHAPAIGRRSALLGGGALLATAGLRGSSAGETGTLRTVDQGALTIACSGEMPMTNVRNGKLIGVAGDMVSLIADRLALKPITSLMDWSATIESVRGGRADIVLGNMGWTPQRSQVLLLTDAVHYAGMYALMRQDQRVTGTISLDDFKGHVLGTVQGFTIVADLKNVPGATSVKL